MGIRVAGRTGAGHRFALAAATRISSPGIVPNKRVTPKCRPANQKGHESGMGSKFGQGFGKDGHSCSG